MSAHEIIDYGVIFFLLFLSVVVVFVAIERLWFYATLRVSDFTDKRRLMLALHKRLTLIATIGANAPYVGLLGTVGGIMLTFLTIGESHTPETKEIMHGLAVALKATAMGIIVAIPSIVFYNFLLRRAEIIATEWDIFFHPSLDPKKARDEEN